MGSWRGEESVVSEQWSARAVLSFGKCVVLAALIPQDRLEIG
jgi:hypothetical protein